MINRVLLIALLATSLTGCIRPYKIDVQQGNIITQEMVNKLKPGMSEADVIAIMGSPVLVNSFSDQRFDYIYTNRVGYTKVVEKRATLYFENHKLTKIIGTIVPEESHPAHTNQ